MLGGELLVSLQRRLDGVGACTAELCFVVVDENHVLCHVQLLTSSRRRIFSRGFLNLVPRPKLSSISIPPAAAAIRAIIRDDSSNNCLACRPGRTNVLRMAQPATVETSGSADSECGWQEFFSHPQFP